MSQPFLPSVRGCFVTGTDTGVGKTCISAGLLHWCAQQGWRSAGLKPVAAGMEWINDEYINEDVRALRQASSPGLTDADVGPYQFEAACAPHIAAQREGRVIERNVILRSAQALASRSDVLVVEGVGGFRVPLAPGWDTADLASDLGLPVVLVVGLRLGCINHTLLSAEAIVHRGLRLVGWIGNVLEPDMPSLDDNVACLRESLGQQFRTPCLGLVPRLADASAASVRAHLVDTGLQAVFGK
ncbi:dethiobiotin synthase [Rhodoferax sp. TBRC 17660]|uniref:ATP-dependent dethiobiotin synthetase BioD n=1 Tax=Rhodoferax potami TaxID=3068338 RepID=A0ABU3KTK1_9BURK|nr:dethiobiotin synthase [Rhodoferax sp. TBRC 17660]MDT7520574.1 dethiobiotin synthase [Rhodoferax sp. TBRC 17660]